MSPQRTHPMSLLFAAALALWLAPSHARAADAEVGKAVYTANCVSCHGAQGDGKGPVGGALNPPPRDFRTGDFKFDANGDGKAGTAADLVAVVKNGAAAYGGSPLMAPWGHLSDADIDSVVAYVLSMQK